MKNSASLIDKHLSDEEKNADVEAALVNEAAAASTLHAKLLKASKDIPALRDMLEKSVSRKWGGTPALAASLGSLIRRLV